MRVHVLVLNGVFAYGESGAVLPRPLGALPEKEAAFCRNPGHWQAFRGNSIPGVPPESISRTVAIALEFIDVVIPIARICDSYPGGWEQCVLDYGALLGRRVWYDQHLFRDGAMSPSEAQMVVEGWAVLGFEPTETRRNGLHWKDLCVIDWRQNGPTRPCDWLSFDRDSRTAHLAGAEPGPLVWRGHPRP